MRYALLLLGYRARSVSEMDDRLKRKGYTDAVQEAVVSELARLKLLDDAEFAASWVSARRRLGPLRLKLELLQKGIQPDLAEQILASSYSAEEELASAWQIARRATRSVSGPVERDMLQRIRQMLRRRGFSYEVISQVCARLTDPQSADHWLE